MLDPNQFRSLIIDPTIRNLGMYSRAASNLVLGTGLVESNLSYLEQLDGGPAQGIFQCEPATHTDLYQNYLDYRPELHGMMLELRGSFSPKVAIQGNLFYATAICRLHYWRVTEALPSPDDVPALAKYYKRFYNTSLGKGQPSDFIDRYEKYVLNV